MRPIDRKQGRGSGHGLRFCMAVRGDHIAKLPNENTPNYLTVDICAYFCYHLRRYGQL